MWTPKRILLLSAGMVVFLAGYTVYAFFLGGIDGLPPLPEGLLAGPINIERFLISDESDIDRKLQDAFGKQCPQIKQEIKFEVKKKGIVSAASKASFKEPDGRVKLNDFSIALFKYHADNKPPEITTITSDYAFLKFDEPITSPMDLNKGKIAEGELRGHVRIFNNHGTEMKSDDLEVLVEGEPLFYSESSSKIWTGGFVKLIDKQTQPNPTEIKGHGMELRLAKDQPANPARPEASPIGAATATPAKGKSDLNGVESILLKSNVEMHLYIESTSGFMSSSSKPPVAEPKAKSPLEKPLFPLGIEFQDDKAVAKEPPAKSHVVITTDGPFVYDMAKDAARFDSPPAKPGSGLPDQILVLRKFMPEKADQTLESLEDQLYCDQLTLKFRRKSVPPGPGAPVANPKSIDKGSSASNSDREIESAHATANPGAEVVLSLDSENLACHCLELIYQCATADRGARTVLRGNPLEAIKDAHKIKSKELTLESANQKGGGQKIVAQGPGQVDLFDRNPGKGYTTHALWKGLLTSTKYKEGERELDQLTLTEDAVFIDDEHGQKLYGQILQVWLEPGETPTQATPADQNKDSANSGPRQLPRKVEAFQSVSAVSDDLRVSNCDHLTIRFKDILRAANLLPGPVPAQVPDVPAQKPSLQPPGGQPPVTDPARVGSQPKEKEQEKPKRPIDLQAFDVIVDVLRGGDKNELQEVLARGNVHVRQDGEKPGEKGVDIKGDQLNLVHFAEGDVLKVDGNEPRKAELQLGELYLLGPTVTIDQRQNTAVVKGAGAMRMPSNSTFEGSKPTKPGTILTVHWTSDMYFTGRDADFYGNVVAYQENSTLQCQQLQVVLDKSVSLKVGQKGDQAAKVEKVIAHTKVYVEDIEKGKNDETIGQRVLVTKSLSVDNPENQGNAVGPGIAAGLRLETGDEFGSPGAQKPPPKGPAKAPQMMLTRVDFQERMLTTQINPTTRKSTFLGNILVIHVPAEKIDMQVDNAKLPKGGMLLQCGRLTVMETTVQGKKTQVLEAKDSARCWTDEGMFFQADVIVFDQSSDTVTFTGSPGNKASVSQPVGGPGSMQRVTYGQKIMFNRKTNQLQIDGASVIGSRL